MGFNNVDHVSDVVHSCSCDNRLHALRPGGVVRLIQLLSLRPPHHLQRPETSTDLTEAL
jgi:hypothetical protein